MSQEKSPSSQPLQQPTTPAQPATPPLSTLPQPVSMPIAGGGVPFQRGDYGGSRE